MRYFLSLISTFLFLPVFSQSFLNGNFENNTAPADQINLSNSALNAMLPGVTAFGSYGDVDIISSSAYGGGGAQNKKWYIAITGGATDIIALELTEPLIEGKKYSLSFYDRKNNGHPASNVQIGLSKTNDAFGTIVYTCGDLPKNNSWSKRTFTFIAPVGGKYITVQLAGGDLYHWVNIDNFVLNETQCPEVLKIEASAVAVNEGESVTYEARGGNNYMWFLDNSKDSLNGSRIVVTPEKDCIYKVISRQDACPVLTATIAVSVNKKKKDSIVDKITDTNHWVGATPVKFKRHSLNGRKINIQEKIVVKDGLIKLQVWDKNKEDGDIISIYLNGQLIEKEMEVSKSKQEITLHLQSGSNLLVLYAINMGKIPPNTAAITLKSGNKSKLTTLVSDLKKSGAVEIIYTNEELTSR